MLPHVLVFGGVKESLENNYVIVQNYSMQKDLIFERMDLMLESNLIFVIDEHGNDVTETIEKDRFLNMTLDQKEDFLKYLASKKYNLLKGGDFRAANFMNEIDGVFNGDHYIVPIEYAQVGYQEAIDIRLNETFKIDNQGYYLAKDYESIMVYLIKNDLVMRHPSDTSGIGIPSLHWGMLEQP